MLAVLENIGGQLVGVTESLAYSQPPPVLIYGGRVFVLVQHSPNAQPGDYVYRECVAWWAPPDLVMLPARPGEAPR
jgi:hypothetical protein